MHNFSSFFFSQKKNLTQGLTAVLFKHLPGLFNINLLQGLRAQPFGNILGFSVQNFPELRIQSKS